MKEDERRRAMNRSSSIPPRVSHVRGSIRGSAVVGAFEYFTKRYGKAAVHEVVTRLPPTSRGYVEPNAPQVGLLGTRSYPYAVIGDLVRTMVSVLRVKEEDFIRELAGAGLDATLGTVHRMVLRYTTSMKSLADKAPEMWDLFHDSGRLRVVALTDHEYVCEVSDWPSHDATLCRLTMEARRHLVIKTGKTNAELFRDKCQGWGNDVCVSRIRW
jgi:hypothetical protein